MKSISSWLLSGSLILCMAGCASQPPTLGAPICPKPAPPTETMLEPAPAPEMFSRCLREILKLADTGTPMSDTCSTFLREERTK